MLWRQESVACRAVAGPERGREPVRRGSLSRGGSSPSGDCRTRPQHPVSRCYIVTAPRAGLARYGRSTLRCFLAPVPEVRAAERHGDARGKDERDSRGVVEAD
jgi:hypothetical protein